MTSAPDKWETVVNKKKSHVTKSDARRAQQKLLDNASNSTLDIKNPLEQSGTIYDAFGNGKTGTTKKKRPVDNDYERPGQGDASAYASRNGSSKQLQGKAVQPKKKPAKLHQIEIDEIQEKIKKLNAKTLEDMIAQAKKQFPNYPLIWLKDVAAWLQTQLGGPAESDVALVSYPKGFPSSSLSNRIRNCLESLICGVQSNVVELLLTHCVTSMFTEAQQGKGTMGFRVLLHIIATKCQDVVRLKMPEILSNKTVSQKAYLSIMWLFGLCQNNLTDGIEVWKSVMLPALHVRSHAPVAVGYLEALISHHKNNKFTKAIITPTELMDFIHLTFGAKSPLNAVPTLRMEMEELFPHLARFAMSDKPGVYAVPVFKRLFNFLKDEDKAVRDKVAETLVFCWSNNKECATVFEESFVSNFSCSSSLLSYICKRQDAVSKMLGGNGWYSKEDVLQPLAIRLLAILDEHRRRGEGSKAGFSECTSYCKQMVSSQPGRQQRTRKSSATRSSWKWFMLKWALYLLLVAVAVDCYKSRGLKGSTTNRVLKRYGLDGHAAKAAGYVDRATTTTVTWIRKNGPHYYSKVDKYVGPVVDTVTVYGKSGYEFARKTTKPAVDYVRQTIPLVLAKIDEHIPGFTETVGNLPRDVQLVYLPKAYEYTCDVVSASVTLCQVTSVRAKAAFVSAMHEIYQLSPSTFDTIEEHVYFVWGKVIEYSPIVCDHVSELAIRTKETALHCIHVGQNWLSTQARS